MTRIAHREASPAGLAVSALRWLGVAILAGVLLAALGPFGSYMNDGPVRRIAYWVGAVLLGMALYGGVFRIAAALTPTGSRLRWPLLILAALIASVPEAIATRAAAFRLWPELAHLDLSFTSWLAQTTTIGLVAILALIFSQRRAGVAASRRPGAPLPVATPAPVLGEDVLALQMEDHYVRVHRPNGSELILLPLGRAIEMVAAAGLQTHRSWWVASDAVVAVEGDRRSMRLRLSNGVVAPVARSAIARLKSAGWIDRRGGDVGLQA